MNNQQLLQSELGKLLILLVGVRKAVMLLRSLYDYKDVIDLRLYSDDLWLAFVWEKTPQGKDYWYRIAEAYNLPCDDTAVRDYQLHSIS